MICPYIVHCKVIRQTSSDFDDDGREIAWQQVEENQAVAMQCEKGNCAAWQDGKCCYRGGQ